MNEDTGQMLDELQDSLEDLGYSKVSAAGRNSIPVALKI